MLGGIKGRRRRGRQRMRWLDGIMDSMNVSLSELGSWWWTGRPGVLQFMESQRVGHDWETKLNWTDWRKKCSDEYREYQEWLVILSGLVRKTSLKRILSKISEEFYVREWTKQVSCERALQGEWTASAKAEGRRYAWQVWDTASWPMYQLEILKHSH